MSVVLPEPLQAEYRRMKRIARVLVLILMAFPVYAYGPLLWKDGSYSGRWDFAADVEPKPAQCRGIAYILQLCEVSFADRGSNRLVKLDYVVLGADWNQVVPDIVRSSSGHFTSSIAISGQGLLTRASAFMLLMMIAYALERLFLVITFRSLMRKAIIMAPAPRIREATLLSRDRRDRI